ncbi:MAG: DUF1684 domain-containing protein [Halanaeroarchaeum sp.]
MPDPDFDEAAWRERLEAFRAEKDAHLADAEFSPVDGDFAGLTYFDPAPGARRSARLQWVRSPETVRLPANRGPDLEFERVATLGFETDDHHVVTAYRAPEAEDLLVPFTDETNGVETASEGRYLALSVDDAETGDRVALDFNFAYHPFSVYDDSYVSVLPPEENHLPMPIKAGERLRPDG